MSDITGLYELVLRESGDYEFIRRDKRPLGPYERDLLIKAVRFSCSNQSLNALEDTVDELAGNAKWFIPQARSELFNIKCGVYFIEDNAYPGLIKIGYTSNKPLARARQLKWQERCADPAVIAFAQTKKYKELEAGLHAKFNDIRVIREWFKSHDVREFINSFQGQS